MPLYMQLFTGTVMIGTTVFLHALGLDLIIRRTMPVENFLKAHLPSLWRPVLSAPTVVSVFSLHVVHIWLWAFLYQYLKCLTPGDFLTALYFSTDVYTTLGNSVATVDAEWRMLGSIEAANGVLLFGWTTAFIFEVVSQFHRREVRSLSD